MRHVALPLLVALVASGLPFNVAWAATDEPRLSGRAWRDSNADGIRQRSERAIRGIRVDLYRSGVDAIDLQRLASTTTDAEGRYAFSDVEEGQLVVGFGLPGERAFTYPDVGRDDTRDSDADPRNGRTAPISFAGRAIRALDAGYLPLPDLVAISGWVWEDWDDDGVQGPDELGLSGAPVTLLREVPARQGPRRRAGGGRRAAGRAEARLETVATVISDLLGDYVFHVAPGRARYRVSVAPPPGYETVLRDQGGADDLDSDIDPVTRRSGAFAPDEARFIDIGLAPLTAIGDRAWLDGDRNGLQDRGEPGVEGAFVLLQRYDPASDAFVFDDLRLTDGAGEYRFGPRRPGTYRLRFLPPAGHGFTRFGVGDDREVDSDARPGTGVSPEILLPDDAYPDGLVAFRRILAAMLRALAGFGRGLGGGSPASGSGALIGGAAPPGGAAAPGGGGANLLPTLEALLWDAGLVPDGRTAASAPEVAEGPIVCSSERSVRDPQVTISDVRALRLPTGEHAFIVRMARELTDDYSFAVVLFIRTPSGVISYMWEIHDEVFRIGRVDPETGQLIEAEGGAQDGDSEAAEIFHLREQGIVGFLLRAGSVPDDADLAIVRSFHAPRPRAPTRCHQTPAFEVPRP